MRWSSTRGAGLRRLVLHLDSYVTGQFAGVCVSHRRGAYLEKGIEVRVAATPAPGAEVDAVLVGPRGTRSAADEVALGSTEQYVLMEGARRLRGRAELTAVGAMFGRSPIALMGLAGPAARRGGPAGRPKRIGVHEDTLALARAALRAGGAAATAGAEVVALERESKLAALLGGEVDMVQVYDVLEAEYVGARLGGLHAVELVPLHGLGGGSVDLGYAQVLFADAAALATAANRELVADFVDATMSGWEAAMRSPRLAAEDVMRTMEMFPEVRLHHASAPPLPQSPSDSL